MVGQGPEWAEYWVDWPVVVAEWELRVLLPISNVRLYHRCQLLCLESAHEAIILMPWLLTRLHRLSRLIVVMPYALTNIRLSHPPSFRSRYW